MVAKISNTVKEIKNRFEDSTIYDLSSIDFSSISRGRFDMKLIETIIESIIKTNPQYSLKMLQDMVPLDVKSVQGVVSTWVLPDTTLEVIVKTSKTDSCTVLMKEYIIGMYCTNELRLLVPNFVYVYGGYFEGVDKSIYLNTQTPKTSQCHGYVIYEKIPGNSLEARLKEDTIQFDEWLALFCQILLALELAQREYAFTHYDLHPGNIMVNPILTNYSVHLDNKTYTIDHKSLGVIIDYGFVSVQTGDIQLGNVKFDRYGMMNSMIQGYDMYKLLIYSVAKSNSKSMRQQICKLFKFYGQDDLYELSINEKKLSKALKEYGKQGAYSQVSKYTPLMMFNWIQSQFHTTNITITARFILGTYPVSKNITTLETIVKPYIKATTITKDSSYLVSMTFYNGMQECCNGPFLKSGLSRIKREIQKNLTLIQDNDIRLLEMYSLLVFMDENELLYLIKNVLAITIGDKKIENQEILRLFKAVEEFDFITQYYIRLLYMARRMKLGDQYMTAFENILKSPHFQVYMKNISLINQAIRWLKTIERNSKLVKCIKKTEA
jgi:hypothetical protein